MIRHPQPATLGQGQQDPSPSQTEADRGHRPRLSGIILAGGRGQRMGGIDKGWQEYRGQPLIQHALERLRPQVDDILISANRNLARYQQLGHPVVSDLQQGFPGPLAGILAAGRQASAPWLLVVPCDLPQLPLDLAWRLLNAAEQGSAQLAMAHDGVRSQQLCLLLQRRLLDDLDGYLACGERRVISWIERHSWAQADFSDRPQAFCNINHLTADTEALL